MSEPIPTATPGATAYGGAETTTPPYSDRPVAIRGPESLGGLLLILAGIVAAVSLVLDWLWQPLVIVLGGGVLFVLGLVLWLPARSHRFVGAVALIVSLAVTAGVLVPLIDATWKLGFFGPGFWCAIAVAVLGLLGSLKAVLTRPKRG